MTNMLAHVYPKSPNPNRRKRKPGSTVNKPDETIGTTSTTSSVVTPYPPTAINDVYRQYTPPSGSVRPTGEKEVLIGTREILGHQIGFYGIADTYKLGHQEYLTWYNNIPDREVVNADLSATSHYNKVDDSHLIVGMGLSLGYSSNILFTGNDILDTKSFSGMTNKDYIPDIGDSFIDSAEVELNTNLSELEAWVLKNNAIRYRKQTDSEMIRKSRDYFLYTIKDVISYSGYDSKKILNNFIELNNKNFRLEHRVHYSDKDRLGGVIPWWGTQSEDAILRSYDENTEYTTYNYGTRILYDIAYPWRDINAPMPRYVFEGVKYNGMYLSIYGSGNTLDISTPHEPYTEPFTRGDSWIESSAMINVVGNNNFIKVEINDRHVHLWDYGGNDAHRSLVSMDGYNNIVVVVINGSLEIGFKNQLDNFGYWMASNDHRNLLIVQTGDGSPLHTKLKWKNIENMNSSATGPKTFFCKFEHDGEHRPFKSWVKQES